MGFSQAVRTCLSKYVTFSGRASRAEYWWFLLFVLLGQFVFSLLDAMLGFGGGWSEPAEPGMESSGRQSPLAFLFSLAMILPLLSVAARRLHDRDMVAWWLLLNLVPLIGSLILLVLYLLPGDAETNRFGPPPAA